MSWRDRAALAVASAGGHELTKPTKAPSVSFVSACPAPIPLSERRGACPGTANVPPDDHPKIRQERALAYLEEHPQVKRTCFADVSSDPDNVILTVAVRDPWGVIEVAVSKDRFDALALMDLASGYPDTALSVPEH